MWLSWLKRQAGGLETAGSNPVTPTNWYNQPMNKFKFEKLVRDEIVPQIISNGSVPKYRKLSSKEFRNALIDKLKEEIKEITPYLEKDEMAEELADIKEVVNYLTISLGIDNKTLRSIEKKKSKKNGGFEKQYYIDYVECSENDPWLNYYLKHPDKYPKLK